MTAIAKEHIRQRVAGNEMANAVRLLAADAVQRANSGDPGMPMGMADVATVLFSRILKFNPQDPDWQDRARFERFGTAGNASRIDIIPLPEMAERYRLGPLDPNTGGRRDVAA